MEYKNVPKITLTPKVQEPNFSEPKLKKLKFNFPSPKSISRYTVLPKILEVNTTKHNENKKQLNQSQEHIITVKKLSPLKFNNKLYEVKIPFLTLLTKKNKVLNDENSNKEPNNIKTVNMNKIISERKKKEKFWNKPIFKDRLIRLHKYFSSGHLEKEEIEKNIEKEKKFNIRLLRKCNSTPKLNVYSKPRKEDVEILNKLYSEDNLKLNAKLHRPKVKDLQNFNLVEYQMKLLSNMRSFFNFEAAQSLKRKFTILNRHLLPSGSMSNCWSDLSENYSGILPENLIKKFDEMGKGAKKLIPSRKERVNLNFGEIVMEQIQMREREEKEKKKKNKRKLEEEEDIEEDDIEKAKE